MAAMDFLAYRPGNPVRRWHLREMTQADASLPASEGIWASEASTK